MVSFKSFGIRAIENRRFSANNLYSSMRRLSTGNRLNRPGDAPADYGLSEKLRMHIRRNDVAKSNVGNMIDMINTSDEWLQVSHDILKRMSEISISSIDDSKIQADRDKLNAEFGQLKEELTRISGQARYNGVQITGADQVLTYDNDKETFLLSQLDGSETYTLSKKILGGVKTNNNEDFLFDATKDYTLSGDGTAIYYVDENNHMVKYNIEENTLERDSADAEEKSFDTDEKGEMWYVTETSTGSGVYKLRQQDISNWAQDTSTIDDTSITDIASKEFKVYQDRVYYLNTGGDIVSRNLQYLEDVRIELDDTEFTLNTTDGQFAISEQGLYVADVTAPGDVRIINMETNEADAFSTGATTVDGLSFNADSTTVAFNDTTEKAIYTMVVQPGSEPRFKVLEKIHVSGGSLGYSGLSLNGASHRLNFRAHNGPEAVQEAFVRAGDVRLFTLGITRASVGTVLEAKDALARTKEAMETVGLHRARLGAAAQRFGFNHAGLQSNSDNISMAESRIRETDMAEEIAKMTNEQVIFEGTHSLILKANSLTQSALQLLSR
jgi:flagellin